VFNLDARVKQETGLSDHLEVSANHGYVTGTHEEIDLFRLYAGAAPQDFKIEDTSEMYGRLFKVAPNNGRLKLPLGIRKIPSVWGGNNLPAPPFSGKLETKRRPLKENQFICKLATHLHLNPSKGWNRCPSLTSENKPVSWVEAILGQRPKAELARGLDSKDNVIPKDLLEPARRYGTFRYFRAVYGAIESELKRASATADGLPMPGNIRTEDFSLRRVETYWEFSATDAVTLVKKLAPALGAYHKHSREREHGADFEIVGNAPTITLFLSAGESIRVYAKTADRIRFEVIHSPKEQNGLIPGGYSSPTLETCMGKLDTLRQKAALRVNQALAFLAEWAEETPQDRASASRYASRWFQCLGFSDASECLLELLRTNGRIVSGQYLSNELNSMARRAKEEGLVFYDEHASALYPVSIGTPLPISGHSLTGAPAEHTNLGHNTETHPVVSVPKSPTPIRKRNGRVGIPPCPPFFASCRKLRTAGHFLRGKCTDEAPHVLKEAKNALRGFSEEGLGDFQFQLVFRGIRAIPT
jgi:hypothetical protein